MSSDDSDVSQALPSDSTIRNAVMLAIKDDKPILMDYWADSLTNACCIGVRESTNEKILVKSSDAYTSCISKIMKSGTEFLVITENSIYIVSNNIKPRKIT
jgi:hypothetical protein